MPSPPESPLAKAQAARRREKEKTEAKIRMVIDAALVDVADPHWTFKTYRELVKVLGREEKTIKFIMRRMGYKGGLEYIRREKMGLAQMTDADSIDGPMIKAGSTRGENAAALEKWTILDLFDRLMHHFDIVEESEKDVDEGPPADANEIEGWMLSAGRDKRSTWVAWRVFLAAAFGLPKSDLEIDHSPDATDKTIPTYPGVDDPEIPRGAAAVPAGADAQSIFEHCTGREAWPEKLRAKIVSLIVGRRGGKSYITSVIGIYLATRKYRLKLGTKGMVMILARDRDQARIIRGYILAFLGVLDELREQFADDPTQKLIELRSGITIEVRAAGDAGTRGYTVVAALMDEIAFWPTDPESAKQDKKVLRALRPSMLGITNAMIVMLSSPYAKRGELFETWRKSYGKDDQSRVLVWQADTLSMRPDDDPDLLNEIREEYQDDPESAQAEYGGNFRTDLENIYSRTALEAVAVPGRIEMGYRTGVRYRAFVDPSGGSSDSYVVAIGHEEERTVGGEAVKFAVLDVVKEWVPKFDPEEVSKECVELLKRYHVTSVTGDAYAGEWPRDPLKKRGVQYVLSDKNRSELYLDFLPMVNSARCELLDLDHYRKAMNQFANLERRMGRSGKDTVDHPPGSHDDVANAIAGVMVGCQPAKKQSCTWGD